jgi:hypothetical protein
LAFSSAALTYSAAREAAVALAMSSVLEGPLKASAVENSFSYTFRKFKNHLLFYCPETPFLTMEYQFPKGLSGIV